MQEAESRPESRIPTRVGDIGKRTAKASQTRRRSARIYKVIERRETKVSFETNRLA
jgi:hypothetical protein